MAAEALLEFDISVPTAFYGKEMGSSVPKESFSKKHYMYQVLAKKLNLSRLGSQDSKQIELVDSVPRRFQEFKILHAVLESMFPSVKLPPFPDIPKSKTKNESDIPTYVHERRAALDKYIRELKDIPEIRQSYEFQQFLPKTCHILAKTRYKGLNVSAKETLGFLLSQNVQINVNLQLKLIRITTQKNSLQRAALSRSNITFSDIQDWSEVSEKGKFKCILELTDGNREFLFNSKSDLQIFTQLLKDMEECPAKLYKQTSSDLDSAHRDLLLSSTMSRISGSDFKKTLRDTRSLDAKHMLKEDPKKDYKMFVTSWNMARTNHESFAKRLIPPKEDNYDFLVYGFQECKSFEGKLRNADLRISEDFLSKIEEDYYLVGRKAIWEINIAVYAKKQHRNDITSVDVRSIATGFLGMVGNKGACAVAFRIMNTSICFVTSHLAAHQKRFEQRNQMFQEIVNGLQIGDDYTYLTHHYDVIIWFGDLNYRIDMSSDNVIQCVKLARWDMLARRDQLINQMSKKKVFCGFREYQIAFPPTYKLNMPKLNKSDVKDGEEEEDDDEDSPSESPDDEEKSKEQDFSVSFDPSSEFFRSRVADADLMTPKASDLKTAIAPESEFDTHRSRLRRFEDMPRNNELPIDLPSDLYCYLKSQHQLYHRRSSSDPEVSNIRKKVQLISVAERAENGGLRSSKPVLSPTTKGSRLEMPRGSGLMKGKFNALANFLENDTLKRLVSEPKNERKLAFESYSKTLPTTLLLINQSSNPTAACKGTRTYDTYRIPAWTDRILSRVNWHGEADVILFQNEYKTGSPANESDHFPVIASFNLKASSIPPTRIYQEKVDIWVNSIVLTIDRTVAESSKIFEGVEEIFLMFHGVSLTQAISTYARQIASSNLISNSLRESGTLAEEKPKDLKSSGTLSGSSNSNFVEIKWDDSEIPSMQLVTSSVNFLKNMRVIVSLCRADATRATQREAVLLQSQIFLNPVTETNMFDFQTVLSSRGVDAGTISGRVFIDFKD